MRRNDTELWNKLKENPFLFHLYKKVHKKRENALILVTGKVQKGKSTVARKIATSIDPNFTIDRIVWRPEQFMDILNSGIKRGDVINFEEIGTESGGIPRRKWFSFNNMVINDVLQTFGFEGLIVIFTVPTKDYIDSNALKLIDYRVKVLGKNIRKRENTCKIYRTEYDDDLSKIYRHKIINPISGRKVDLFITKKSNNRKLERAYKKKEEAFKLGIQKTIRRRMKKEERPSDTEYRICNDARDRIMEFVRRSGKRLYIHQASIESEYDIGFRIAKRVKTRLELEIHKNKELYKRIRKKLRSNPHS